jgi:hypothetical protein
MNRTQRHLVYGLAWLLAFIVIAVVVSLHWDASNVGIAQFRSQVGSLLWVLGFAAIFFSWARTDAVEHGKTWRTAAVFAVLWVFLVFIAHMAYLLYSRGLRNGIVSVLKFVCFLLASAIGMAAVGKLLGLILH